MHRIGIVMANGTVLHTYRDRTPGRMSSGLSDSCHMIPNSEAPASKIQGFHMEKNTRARLTNPQPMRKL